MKTFCKGLLVASTLPLMAIGALGAWVLTSILAGALGFSAFVDWLDK